MTAFTPLSRCPLKKHFHPPTFSIQSFLIRRDRFMCCGILIGRRTILFSIARAASIQIGANTFYFFRGRGNFPGSCLRRGAEHDDRRGCIE
jgi:hypothetical protein